MAPPLPCSPIVSPVVSDEEVAFLSQASPAGQRRRKERKNPEDLGQEGPGRRFLRPDQLFLHNEESHQLVSTLMFDEHGTTSGPENLLVGSLDWDGEGLHTWEKFKTKHGLDEAFLALHGTHASRYTGVIEKARRPLEKLKQLCRAVPMAGDERREPPDADHRFVAAGLKEIERYEAFRDAPRPEPTHQTLPQPYFFLAKEINVNFILMEFTPFMGYAPGSYLLRLMDHFITEGIVPYTQEENIYRLVDDVVPSVKDMVLAFVEFDPRDINRMSRWCKKLRRKNVLELTAQDMEEIHDKWERRFMDPQTRPSVRELQRSGSESKFLEAAWLLTEVERSGAVYPWSDGFKQLLQDATGQCVDDLCRRYIGEILHNEALGCIRNDQLDRVLAYDIPVWAPNTDVFAVYKDRGALVNEFAPSPQRLAEIRNTAEKLLHQHLPEDEVAEILCEYNSPIGPHAQHSAQHGSDPDDNIPSDEECIATDSNPLTLQQPASPGSKAPPIPNNKKRKRAGTTHKTSSALPGSQSAPSSTLEPPSPSEEPVPTKRGRGRPKKKAGDPKSPYTRRKPASERSKQATKS